VSGGEGLNFNKAKLMVQKFADKQLSARNQLTSSDGCNEVADSTVNVYMEEIAQCKQIGISSNIMKKTLVSIASENSLHSVMTFLFVIAGTHYIKGQIPMKHPSRSKHGTDGSKKLLLLIEEAEGKKGAFYPVHPSLISSQDETTIFVSPSKIESKKTKGFLFHCFMIRQHKCTIKKLKKYLKKVPKACVSN
jgi:hypothetical protein